MSPLLLSKKIKRRALTRYLYVQGILISVVAAFVVTILGPEHHGSHFEKGKVAFEQGAGEIDLLKPLVEDNLPSRIESPLVDEKAEITEREHQTDLEHPYPPPSSTNDF